VSRAEKHEAKTMTYRLFFTDFEVPLAVYQAQKSRLITYTYNELDDALGMAKRIMSYGGVPWEIEQEDGTLISRAEIAKLLRERAPELVNRPKVY
jgi:hypothetical protein